MFSFEWVNFVSLSFVLNTVFDNNHTLSTQILVSLSFECCVNKEPFHYSIHFLLTFTSLNNWPKLSTKNECVCAYWGLSQLLKKTPNKTWQKLHDCKIKRIRHEHCVHPPVWDPKSRSTEEQHPPTKPTPTDSLQTCFISTKYTPNINTDTINNQLVFNQYLF